MPSPGAQIFTNISFDAPTTITAEGTDAAGDNSTTYSFGIERETFRGALGGSDTADWIELPRNTAISGSVTLRKMTAVDVVGINGTDTADLQLRVYRAGGVEMAENPDLATGMASRRFFAPDNNGRFFVEVTSISGAPAEYELRTDNLGASLWGDDSGQGWSQGTGGGDTLFYFFGGNDNIRGSSPSNLIFAGDGDDIVSAAGDTNIFYGGNGNDTLRGNFGESRQETIFGGDGDDRIFYGNFSDGGAGNDSITGSELILGGTGDDRIQAVLTGDDLIYGGAGDGRDLIMAYLGDDTVFAGGGDDTVFGGDGNDRLRGGDGDDTLFGGSDNDIIRGGAGADDIRGGSGFDTADYRAATQGITLDLTTPANNAGAAAGDVLTSIEAVRGTGFADQITGNAFRNVLHGGDGDDTLTGGGGEDVFVFTPGTGADVITDFDATMDTLRFASGPTLSVTDDGVDTMVTYGSDSVTLQGVVLSEAEIDIAFF